MRITIRWVGIADDDGTGADVALWVDSLDSRVGVVMLGRGRNVLSCGGFVAEDSTQALIALWGICGCHSLLLANGEGECHIRYGFMVIVVEATLSLEGIMLIKADIVVATVMEAITIRSITVGSGIAEAAAVEAIVVGSSIAGGTTMEAILMRSIVVVRSTIAVESVVSWDGIVVKQPILMSAIAVLVATAVMQSLLGLKQLPLLTDRPASAKLEVLGRRNLHRHHALRGLLMAGHGRGHEHCAQGRSLCPGASVGTHLASNGK